MFTIPDHDAVTRRMQFRAKKGRKAKKMEKKEEKKKQAEKKKEQKEQKKAEKQKKAEEKQTAKALKKAEKEEKKKRVTEGETTEGMAPKSQKTELSSPAEIESGSQTCSRDSKKVRGRRLRKRGLLRKMKKGKMTKKNDIKQTEAKTREGSKTDEKKETMERDQKRLPSQPATSQPKPKVAKVSEEFSIDSDAKALVIEILQECRDSECTHPSWELPAYDKNLMALSIYWSRFAVGIKMPPQYSSPKAKKCTKKSNRWNQIAYFSCPTCCPYSNIALARLYVP